MNTKDEKDGYGRRWMGGTGGPMRWWHWKQEEENTWEIIRTMGDINEENDWGLLKVARRERERGVNNYTSSGTREMVEWWRYLRVDMVILPTEHHLILSLLLLSVVFWLWPGKWKRSKEKSQPNGLGLKIRPALNGPKAERGQQNPGQSQNATEQRSNKVQMIHNITSNSKYPSILWYIHGEPTG